MANSWAVQEVIRIAGELEAARNRLRTEGIALQTVAQRLVEDGDVAVEDEWAFPVGTGEFPPEAWYVAVVHDLTGAKNGGYRHSGIDINLDRWPWGDVERGAPVRALTTGTVVAKGSSAGWLGVLLVRYQHEDAPLYVRYAHLDADRFQVIKGEVVEAGQVLGYLGDWQGGDSGDHLHLDMANQPFEWNWWLTERVNWMDPVPVLKAHLDEEIVDLMLGRGDG